MKCGITSENFLFMVLRSAVIFRTRAEEHTTIGADRSKAGWMVICHFSSLPPEKHRSFHNPLYKAFKTKNFSDYDILLHFCILDMLAGGKELAFRNIAGELQEYGFSGEENVINERTIRLKLQEYEKLGILKVRTEGKKKQYYSLSADAVDLVSWQDAIEFFSETEPMGIVGSFLLDRKELAGCPSSFWYKHHYMLHAIDSEIVEAILEGITEKKYLELVAIGKKQQERKIKLYPIKLYVSTQNGREYVLGHVSGAAGLHPGGQDKEGENRNKM